MSTVNSGCFAGFWRCPRLGLGVLRGCGVSKGFGGVHGYFLVFEGFWRCPRLFLYVLKGFGSVHAYFLVFWRVLEVSTVISWFWRCPRLILAGFEGFWRCPRLFLGVLKGFGVF